MAETKIVLNRQSDLILDNANITAPVGIVVADIDGLESAILSIDTAESAHMSAEVSSRISGDASIMAFTTVVRDDAWEGIETEISNRLAGDESIAANLSQELVDRANAVSSEESARISEDEAIRDDLSALEMQLSTEVSTEASNRVEGDVSVTAAMSAEISTRIVAETSLQNNIDAEASTGLVRDNAEASMARAAEQSLATDLDAEQSRAESAEASLNVKVENVISNVDPAALDSLTEIVGAFQSADGDLNGAITALGSSATAAVDNEASIRLAADQSLAGDLSSEIADREAAVSLEEAARISGDASVNADLSTEIEARISDVNAEQARAESVEDALYNEINTTDAVMGGRISTETSRAESAEASLTADLSTEVSNRLSSESVIYSDMAIGISTEVSVEAFNRLNVDNELFTQLSTEVVRAMDAEATLTVNLSTEISDRGVAIDNEASIRLAADNSIAAGLSSELVARASAVTSEASSRLSADTSIAAGLSSELVARSSADTSLDAKLSAANSSIEAMPYTDGTTIIVDATSNTIQLKSEVAAPSGGTRTFSGLINVAAQPASLAGFGDLTLVTKSYVSGQVSTEASTRLAGDNSIAAGLSTELVDRAAADASIATNLSTEKARIDAILLASDADKDSFKEIVDLINSVDTTNDQAFASYVLSNDAALSSELVARASADTSLEVALSTSVSNANASIDAAISTEISERGVAIDNEASIRLAADESLATDLGLGDLGGDVEWEAYLDALTNGWDFSSYNANAVYTAEEFNQSFGPSNLINFTAWRERRLSVITGWYNSTELSRAESAEASLDAAKLNLDGGTMSGAINMGGNNINSVERLTGESIFVNTIANPNGDSIIEFTDGRWKLVPNIDADGTAQIINLPTPVNLGDAANKWYVDNADQSLATALSSEISRAEAAEDSLEIALSSEVSYLLANTDLSSIDSFAEVSDALAAQVSDFTAIYFKKATFTGLINGTNDQFTLSSSVRGGSETVYLNGLLQEAGVDYTVAGDVITLTSAPQTGDKVVIYAVY